jgi:hypothetical protein
MILYLNNYKNTSKIDVFRPLRKTSAVPQNKTPPFRGSGLKFSAPPPAWIFASPAKGCRKAERLAGEALN